MPRTYEWDKSDTVYIRVHGAYHCAPPEVCKPSVNGQLGCRMTYHFNVKVMDTSNALDSRGFLFEQVHITGLLDGLPSTELSCERLTKAAHCYVLDSIQNENPHLRILYSRFSLSPTTTATVIHCCDDVDEIRDFVSTIDRCRSLLFPNEPASVASVSKPAHIALLGVTNGEQKDEQVLNLAYLLRDAERAHAAHIEAQTLIKDADAIKKENADWYYWYAAYLTDRLRSISPWARVQDYPKQVIASTVSNAWKNAVDNETDW